MLVLIDGMMLLHGVLLTKTVLGNMICGAVSDGIACYSNHTWTPHSNGIKISTFEMSRHTHLIDSKAARRPLS
eukprot:1008394-Alexandrium_andersonii.AAC.1